MNILMLTWEFPPNKVGGVATHTYDLSRALARKGHDVHIVTFGMEDKDERIEGVNVHRVNTSYAPDTISWCSMLSHFVEKKALELFHDEKFEIVHAHDWMLVPAAASIKKMLNIPFVFTLHSTEHGRGGVYDSQSKAINDLEWYGTYEANEIITVSKDFKNEVSHLFQPPKDKLHIIPNGVDFFRFNGFSQKEKRKTFQKFAGDDEKIVLFVGRMVHQKGVDKLIGASKGILDRNPDAKFIFVGNGAVDHYKGLAHQRIGNKAYFPGYIDDKTLACLYQVAHTTVVPSVYEPFGIVALESLAAGTPVIASDTGGLHEIVVHEWCGLKTYVGDARSVYEQTCRVMEGGQNWNDWLGKNGQKRVLDYYNWDRIADWTTGVYGRSLGLW